MNWTTEGINEANKVIEEEGLEVAIEIASELADEGDDLAEFDRAFVDTVFAAAEAV